MKKARGRVKVDSLMCREQPATVSQQDPLDTMNKDTHKNYIPYRFYVLETVKGLEVSAQKGAPDDQAVGLDKVLAKLTERGGGKILTTHDETIVYRKTDKIKKREVLLQQRKRVLKQNYLEAVGETEQQRFKALASTWLRAQRRNEAPAPPEAGPAMLHQGFLANNELASLQARMAKLVVPAKRGRPKNGEKRPPSEGRKRGRKKGRRGVKRKAEADLEREDHKARPVGTELGPYVLKLRRDLENRLLWRIVSIPSLGAQDQAAGPSTKPEVVNKDQQAVGTPFETKSALDTNLIELKAVSTSVQPEQEAKQALEIPLGAKAPVGQAQTNVSNSVPPLVLEPPVQAASLKAEPVEQPQEEPSEPAISPSDFGISQKLPRGVRFSKSASQGPGRPQPLNVQDLRASDLDFGPSSTSKTPRSRQGRRDRLLSPLESIRGRSSDNGFERATPRKRQRTTEEDKIGTRSSRGAAPSPGIPSPFTPNDFGSFQNGDEKPTEAGPCYANLLSILEDRGVREKDVLVELKPDGTGFWGLVVSKGETELLTHKAEQFGVVGTSNRNRQSMLWKIDKALPDSSMLEFKDKAHWNTFKYLHEECSTLNRAAARQMNIPIPGVVLVPGYEASLGRRKAFVRPDKTYIKYTETLVSLAMQKTPVSYDADSDDEDWLEAVNTGAPYSARLPSKDESDTLTTEIPRAPPLQLEPCSEQVSLDQLEQIVDCLEKESFLREHVLVGQSEAVQLCKEIGPEDLVIAVYAHWHQRRQRLGMALIQHFQPPPWERYQEKLTAWKAYEQQRTAESAGENPLPEQKKPGIFAFCLRPGDVKEDTRRLQRKSSEKQQAETVNLSWQGRKQQGSRKASRTRSAPLSVLSPRVPPTPTSAAPFSPNNVLSPKPPRPRVTITVNGHAISKTDSPAEVSTVLAPLKIKRRVADGPLCAPPSATVSRRWRATEPEEETKEQNSRARAAARRVRSPKGTFLAAENQKPEEDGSAPLEVWEGADPAAIALARETQERARVLRELAKAARERADRLAMAAEIAMQTATRAVARLQKIQASLAQPLEDRRTSPRNNPNPEQPVRQGRGSRQKPQEDQAPKVAVVSTEPPPGKRKRGRPPKKKPVAEGGSLEVPGPVPLLKGGGGSLEVPAGTGSLEFPRVVPAGVEKLGVPVVEGGGGSLEVPAGQAEGESLEVPEPGPVMTAEPFCLQVPQAVPVVEAEEGPSGQHQEDGEAYREGLEACAPEPVAEALDVPVAAGASKEEGNNRSTREGENNNEAPEKSQEVNKAKGTSSAEEVLTQQHVPAQGDKVVAADVAKSERTALSLLKAEYGDEESLTTVSMSEEPLAPGTENLARTPAKLSKKVRDGQNGAEEVKLEEGLFVCPNSRRESLSSVGEPGLPGLEV